MSIVLLVVLLFSLAVATPLLRKLFGNYTGWFLALFPFSGFIWFLTLLPEINQGLILEQRFEWLPAFDLYFSFYADGLSVFFSLLILGIGAFILIYAGYYMKGYPMQGRFLAYMVLFMASMFGIVVAGNLISLFVFWELTSISSYLLIGYNHEKPEARGAALQALLITGLGGLALLGGFVLVGSITGTYELSELLTSTGVIKSSHLYSAALLLILVGAFTKSAQFPFHFWLPGAMAAPSPVSAYLHSATMVKAGVFLLARLNPVMGGTDLWFYILSIVGATTMFVGAYLSITQTDLKRILAYTTVSALGTLVLLLGTSTAYAFNAAIVFLLVHALYKGTLFMMAGTIEKKAGTRDITKLGGLFKYMPFAGVVMVLALVSMAGVPPMLGFIGKELIYEAKVNAPSAHWFIVSAGFSSNVILVFLSLRLAIDVFWGKEPEYSMKPKEPSLALILGPAVLVLSSLVLGIFPALLANPLTSKAIADINPSMSAIKLELWHGFNMVLLLSLVTLISGYLAFKNRFKIIPVLERFNYKYFSREFSKFFFIVIDKFLILTKAKTKTIQHGYHRYYLMTIFVVASILVWIQIWNSGPVFLELDFGQIPLHLVAIVALTIAATFIAASSSSRVIALIATGIVGFGITLIFLNFSGVDLPITMILVETIMVILVTGLLVFLPRFGGFSDTGARMRDLLVASMVGLFFVVLVIKSSSLSMGDRVSDFFKLNSLDQAYGKNIVNVILVDFRALDTLGEIAVLAIAAIGIYSLISFTKSKR